MIRFGVVAALGLVLAADIATIQLVLTTGLSFAGIVAGVYATRRMMLSDRRSADAEKEANAIKERTVDREDFDSVVEGLRGVIAERTASYNEILGALRDERERGAEKDRRISEIETQLRSNRRPGGRQHD